MNRSLLLTCIAFIPSLVWAEPRSLRDITRDVLQRSPQIRATVAAGNLARATGSETRASRYPRLDLGLTGTRGDGPVYAFASLLNQKNFGPANFGNLTNPGYVTDLESHVRVAVPLFTGLTLTRHAQQARLFEKTATIQNVAVQQNLRVTVLETGLTALSAHDLLALLDPLLKSAEADVVVGERLRARGMTLGSDQKAAEALLFSLKARREAIDQERLGAETTLAILLNETAPVTPHGTLAGPGPLLPPLDELLTSAKTQSPFNRMEANKTDLSALETKLDRSRLWPTVDALAEVQTHSEDLSTIASQRLLMVRAMWGLGDPAQSARQRRWRETLAGQEESQRSAEQSVATGISQAHRAHTAARALLPLTEEGLRRAREAVDLLRPLFREGRQNVYDMLRAQDGLVQAYIQRRSLLLQDRLSHAQALAQAGLLTETVHNQLINDLEN